MGISSLASCFTPERDVTLHMNSCHLNPFTSALPSILSLKLFVELEEMVNCIHEIQENTLLLHRPEKLTYKKQVYCVMEVCTSLFSD